ncbi:MAG: type 1 glutamine amidotransferase [Actinobacteria bacterium]|nr:type 1 glutamine amidotransferase [Actinomycetota bacterium]
MRILSVTHGPTVPGGVFDQVVEASGHELERWVVPLGGSPQPASSYDALMVFGGSMHPDQDERFAWLEREAGVLREALAEDVPVFGVCLGAQMLARAAGAWVGPAGEPEVGWFEVELTPEGRSDPVLGVLSPRTEAFQWHHYTFEIPGGGTELARSSVCTQAFRVGERAWGIQFHAEVTLDMMRTWTAEDPDDLPVGAEEFLAAAETRIANWNEQGRALCAAFLKMANGS